MKERIEELAGSMCKTNNLSSPSSEWFLTTDGLAKQAITTAVNEALETAAMECEKIWKSAPNTRESGWRQNEISHGCIASAEAIRKLKIKESSNG